MVDIILLRPTVFQFALVISHSWSFSLVVLIILSVVVFCLGKF